MAVLTQIGNIIIIIIIIINGRENKGTTAVIITCRTKPILTFRWRLVTYKRLVSAGESISVLSRALTSRRYPWIQVLESGRYIGVSYYSQ